MSNTMPHTTSPTPLRWELNRRDLLKAFGIGGMAALLSACGAPLAAPSAQQGAAAPVGPTKGGTLICAGPFDFGSFNPLLGAGGNNLLWSRLFKFDANLNPLPDLAEGFEISEDRTVYTVKLRQNAKWHDGVPVTADDVVFTVESDLKPENNFPMAFVLKVGGEPVKVAKVDDHTVTFTVAEPYAPLLAHLAATWVMPIAPKHLLEGVDPQTAEFNANPVGSGPFKFKEVTMGDHLTVTRFDDYYLGAPLLDEIIIRVLTDKEARLAAFQAGEIDLDLREEDLITTNQFATVAGAKAYYLDTPYVQQLTLKNDDPLFADAKVRQAISHALDKPNMVRTVVGDQIYTAWSVVGKIHWAHNPDVVRYEYDVEKAKALLAEAGWADSDGDGVLEKDGTKFVFTHSPWRDFERAYAPLTQQFLKAVGIQMDIALVPDYASVEALRQEGKAQSLIFGCIDYEPGELFQYWHSSRFPPEGQNVYFYANARVDELLVQGQAEVDPAVRKGIYQEVQALIAADAATIPLHFHVNNEIVRADRVAGFPEPAGNWNGVLYQEPWNIYKIA